MIRLVFIYVALCLYLILIEYGDTSNVIKNEAKLIASAAVYILQVIALYIFGKIYCIEHYKINSKSYYANVVEYIALPLVCVTLVINLDVIDNSIWFVASFILSISFYLMMDISGVIKKIIQEKFEERSSHDGVNFNSAHSFEHGSNALILGIIFYGLVIMLLIKHNIRPVF